MSKEGIGHQDEEFGKILNIAKYVAKNAPVLLVANKEDGKDKGVMKLAGGSLIIEEKKQDLTKGTSYAYPTEENGVQGLTKVTSNPLLYGNMASDQYKLPEPTHLDEKTINKLVGLAKEGKDQDTVKKELQDKKITSLYGQEGEENKSAILSTLGYTPKDKESTGIIQALQAFVGDRHIQKIADKIGVGNETKQYAVLTLTGESQGETKGFGIEDKHRMEKYQSSSTVRSVEGEKPTIGGTF